MKNIKNQIKNELNNLDEFKEFLFERNKNLFIKKNENSIANILHITAFIILYNMVFHSFDFLYVLLFIPSIFILLLINILVYIRNKNYIKNIK